jgi:solute carrier family 35 (UDP-sugar transporter), member A1/2/3
MDHASGDLGNTFRVAPPPPSGSTSAVLRTSSAVASGVSSFPTSGASSSPSRSISIESNISNSAVGNDKLELSKMTATAPGNTVLTRTGLMVLGLLSFQNCFKNLLMRSIMKDQPKFLTSVAVLGAELIKLFASVAYILWIQKRPLISIAQYLRKDFRNTLLLAIPACLYNVNQSLEYVALAHLNAAVFTVLVQSKTLATALFSVSIMKRKLKQVQVLSLLLLTTGIILCNLPSATTTTDAKASSTTPVTGSWGLDATTITGIVATLTIALSSGFASVFTEKVIKRVGNSGGSAGGPTNAGANSSDTLPLIAATSSQNMEHSGTTDLSSKSLSSEYGLSYTQVQLALMSLLTIGIYALFLDFGTIVQHGLFYNFTPGAFCAVLTSAVGGLIVAATLKYADSILKNYATALSVVLTGIFSVLLLGTTLNITYLLGMLNVLIAIVLYNSKSLEEYMC